MNPNKFDIAYVGAGPSTIFSLLELCSSGYKGKILVLEKGKYLPERTDICFGFGGAGTFSDGKLSCHPEVGGSLSSILNDKEFYQYSETILSYLNYFSPTQLNWTKSKPFKGDELGFVQSLVCHLGTENTQSIFLKIQKYLIDQPNIEFKFEEEVKGINNLYPLPWEVITSKNHYKAIRVVLASGPRDTLLPSICAAQNIQSAQKMVQIGIRVESDNSDGKWNKILEANYDFKFTSQYPGMKVRTFCCNSGAAYVAKEENGGAFISWNGHAYKDPSKANTKVNFGIMCEAKSDINKERQIRWCKGMNASFPNSPYPINNFPTMQYLFPQKIGPAIWNFIGKLGKIVDLKDAVFYLPEIKLKGPELNIDKSFKLSTNLYGIGDLVISRGIVQAGISGILFSKGLLDEECASIKNK